MEEWRTATGPVILPSRPKTAELMTRILDRDTGRNERWEGEVEGGCKG